MNPNSNESQQCSRKHASNLSFIVITLIHDNWLRRRFDDPFKTLKAAGLKPGQRVLEVGCGPGFFTIPAANIVGNKGIVHAVDIHPRAVKRVQNKIKRAGIKNVRPMLANASNTGLEEQSIDLTFMFGLPYIADGQENVVSEIHRILKPGGVLSFMKTRRSGKKLIEAMERGGFIYTGRKARIFLFSKVKYKKSKLKGDIQ